MSETYSIACQDCKKRLWIAQGSYSELKKGHIYSSELYMEAMFEFLIDHMGHDLIFGRNCVEPLNDFTEIEIE